MPRADTDDKSVLFPGIFTTSIRGVEYWKKQLFILSIIMIVAASFGWDVNPLTHFIFSSC